MTRIATRHGCEERREKIRLFTEEGRSAAWIAEVLGIAERNVVQGRRALGIQQPVPSWPWTPEQLQLAHNLVEDGCSYAEVGRTLGCDSEVVSRRFPGYGMSGTVLGNGRYLRMAQELGLELH